MELDVLAAVDDLVAVDGHGLVGLADGPVLADEEPEEVLAAFAGGSSSSWSVEGPFPSLNH